MAKPTTNIWERAANAVDQWLPVAVDKIAEIVRGGDMPPFHRKLSPREQVEQFLRADPSLLARLRERAPDEQVAFYERMAKLMQKMRDEQEGGQGA